MIRNEENGDETNMKKGYIGMVACSIFLSIAAASDAFAASWVKHPDGYFYRYDDGSFASNTWELVDGKWYSFNGVGRMRENVWLEEGGNWYYLDASGAMVTGQAVVEDKVTNFDESGVFTGYGAHIDGLEDDVLNESVLQTSRHLAAAKVALEQINALRAEVGKGPLELDYQLSLAASYRGGEMFKYDYFSHFRGSDSRYISVLRAMSNASHSFMAENIYFEKTSNPQRTWEATITEGTQRYKSSPGHYANIINNYAKKVGIGLYRSPDGTTRYYNMIFFS